jgi:hypothetical protein
MQGRLNELERWKASIVFTAITGLMIICIREGYNYIDYYQTISAMNVTWTLILSCVLYKRYTHYIYPDDEKV